MTLTRAATPLMNSNYPPVLWAAWHLRNFTIRPFIVEIACASTKDPSRKTFNFQVLTSVSFGKYFNHSIHLCVVKNTTDHIFNKCFFGSDDFKFSLHVAWHRFFFWFLRKSFFCHFEYWECCVKRGQGQSLAGCTPLVSSIINYKYKDRAPRLFFYHSCHHHPDPETRPRTRLFPSHSFRTEASTWSITDGKGNLSPWSM